MTPVPLVVEPHPLLSLRAFVTELPVPLAECPSPAWLIELLSLDASAPLRSDDTVRAAVRNLLRHGGFKPTGRSKPAPEYLLKAAGEGTLGSINAAVDACNVVSLHSGLPVSVIDLDRAIAPYRVEVAGAGSRYLFNSAGQVIELEGLLCLFDAGGPCANAVKDAERTKTGEATRRTLSVVWGTQALGERGDVATDWYRGLLERLGARTESVV
jgi:DNA/RNA-binding domain of Phe-tRNA-synthetase-like protein